MGKLPIIRSLSGLGMLWAKSELHPSFKQKKEGAGKPYSVKPWFLHGGLIPFVIFHAGEARGTSNLGTRRERERRTFVSPLNLSRSIGPAPVPTWSRL